MKRELDLARAETAQFTASEGHRDLFGMAGSWEGPTRTWFDPTASFDESRTTALIEPILGGRFLRLDYEGTVMSKPHAGEMLLGYESDDKRFTAVWVDSFHMASGIMVLTGTRRDDGIISVLGSYQAGGETWKWRTVLRPIDDESLTIEAYNISPQGREDRAIETRLARRGKQR
jgi:Protein of unknown function (DUF1579)